MDKSKVLALYDSEMRKNPPEEPGLKLEQTGKVLRYIGDQCCIIFSELSSADAPGAIAEQTAFFRSQGKEVEWKVFGHDTPPELGRLLQAVGYVADLPETLMVFDLEETNKLADHGPGAEIRRVTDLSGLAEAVKVSDDAFGPEGGWTREWYASRVKDPTLGIFIAYADGKPVSSARLEMPSGRQFASLWGGGTLPGHRHRGIYRAMVKARAEIARQKGFRYITVDARETSRPILERIGFVPLTGITGWVLKP